MKNPNLITLGKLFPLSFVLFFLFWGLAKAQPQSKAPKIAETENGLFGTQLPENAPDFSLNVTGPDGKPLGKKSLKDFRGRWLILDFWTRYCIACIQSMPKLSAYQQHLGDRAVILLIGNNDPKYGKGIEGLYQRFAKESKLKLYTAFDSKIFSDYKVFVTPHLSIIDPEGKRYAVTTSSELSKEKLDSLISGQRPSLAPLQGYAKSPAPIQKTQIEIPTNSTSRSASIKLADGRIQSYTSTMSEWKPSQPLSLNLDLENAKEGFSTGATSLERLYLIAYFGKGSWRIGDSLYLKASKKVLILPSTEKMENSPASKEKKYNYILKLEGNGHHAELYQQAMQDDLFRHFGYLVTIEQIESQCYELKVIGTGQKAPPRGTVPKPFQNGDAAGYQFKGRPISAILERIAYYHPGLLLHDATGINYPIDIELKTNMLDLEAIRKALQENGLDLAPSKTTLKQLVLRKRP